jgi:hypothetical protein
LKAFKASKAFKDLRHLKIETPFRGSQTLKGFRTLEAFCGLSFQALKSLKG